MCKSWCQPFILGAHHYFDFIGHGIGSWRRVVLSLFVCLFFFQLLRWMIILFLSLTSGWGFLVFCFCFVLFFLQNVPFPNHISRVRLIFFLSRRLVKFFRFLLFLFVCLLLFCFVCFFFFFFPFFLFLLPKIPSPLDIKIWCALIVILLHKWWWILRHQQFWIPVTCVQFSEKSNFNLKLH